MGLMEKFADPEVINSLGFGEKMAGSAVTMIMGMGITFLILILLWGFLALMGKVLGSDKKEKGDKAPEQAKAVAAPSDTVTVSGSGNDELPAVIAAAIAAYVEAGPAGALVVRRITRLSGDQTPWGVAAKGDCIESRKF